MKNLLRVIVLVGLLLALVPLSLPTPSLAIDAKRYAVINSSDPDFVLEAIAYIAREYYWPIPVLLYDGTNTAELQAFYAQYGPFHESGAIPYLLQFGNVPVAARAFNTTVAHYDADRAALRQTWGSTANIDTIAIGTAGSYSDGGKVWYRVTGSAWTAQFTAKNSPNSVRPYFIGINAAESWCSSYLGNRDLDAIYLYGPANSSHVSRLVTACEVTAEEIHFIPNVSGENLPALANEHKGFLDDDILEEGDLQVTIFGVKDMRGDDMAGINAHVAPIYAVYRNTSIYVLHNSVASYIYSPQSNWYQFRTTTCKVGDNEFACLEDVMNEAHSWLDNGDGTSWADGVAFWSSSRYFPYSMRGLHAFGNGTLDVVLELLTDLQADQDYNNDDHNHGYCHQEPSVLPYIMASATDGRLALQAARGVFARKMMHRTRATAVSGYGQGEIPPETHVANYTATYDYFNYELGDRPTQAEFSAAVGDSRAIYTIGAHGGSSYTPGYPYSPIVKLHNSIWDNLTGPPAYAGIWGCGCLNGTVRCPNSRGFAIQKSGVSLFTGGETNWGAGVIYSDSSPYTTWSLYLHSDTDHADLLLAYVSCCSMSDNTVVYGDPFWSVDDSTYWCETHTCNPPIPPNPPEP